MCFCIYFNIQKYKLNHFQLAVVYFKKFRSIVKMTLLNSKAVLFYSKFYKMSLSKCCILVDSNMHRCKKKICGSLNVLI